MFFGEKKKKNGKRNVLYVFVALFVLAFIFVEASANKFVDRGHWQRFISPYLQKNLYKIEVQTVMFLDRQQSDVNGLVESFRGTSSYAYDLFTRSFCYGRGGALDCQSFTYDSAVAAMAYMLAGKFDKAAKILRAYQKEFYREKEGGVGLYNSYRTDIRGSSGALAAGIDGNRIHIGPVMWVAVAAIQYTAITGDTEFFSFIVDTVKWAQHLEHFTFLDGERGGASMGFGWGPDWSRVFSTENNVDYYAVLKMLKKIVGESGNEQVKGILARSGLDERDIDAEMEAVERWLREIAYDSDEKRFNCGYNENGLDTIKALDTVSWTIASLGPDKLVELGVDPYSLMDFAEKYFSVTNGIKDKTVNGFDFTDYSGRKSSLKMVWIEGTAFHTVAYQVMSDYAARTGNKAKAKEYLNKAVKFSDEIEKVSEAVKIVDNALPYTTKCPAEKQVMYTFAYEWEVPRGSKGQWVASVSSTVWRYYAILGFNPLALDTKNVKYRLFQ
ncbi:MAG: hypothetical protein JW803_06520 [Endomicrobiales bacterium]|nr:hypothetical protein [Endomicrobiales bacterium]